jgi:hypothetical protein
MKIEIGSYIKVVCKNGVIEAGRVAEHTTGQLVLELIDHSYTIIQNPYENIVAIRISPQRKESSTEEEVFVDVELEPDRYYRDENLRAKNLAELQKLRAQEERNKAVEHFRRHRIKPVPQPEVLFGTPNLTKPIPQYPKKKTRRRS